MQARDEAEEKALYLDVARDLDDKLEGEEGFEEGDSGEVDEDGDGDGDGDDFLAEGDSLARSVLYEESRRLHGGGEDDEGEEEDTEEDDEEENEEDDDDDLAAMAYTSPDQEEEVESLSRGVLSREGKAVKTPDT